MDTTPFAPPSIDDPQTRDAVENQDEKTTKVLFTVLLIFAVVLTFWFGLGYWPFEKTSGGEKFINLSDEDFLS